MTPFHLSDESDHPSKPKDAKYHADGKYQSDEQLRKWAGDPNCFEMESAAKILSERTAKRDALRDNPFDPRTEVSADAKYMAEKIGNKIVTHLWILFVLLPVVIGVLWAALSAMR